MHRIFAGLVLAVLVWWALRAVGTGVGVALSFAAIPLVSAVLNLLTGPIFNISVVGSIVLLSFVYLVDDPAKDQLRGLLSDVTRGPNTASRSP